MNQKIAAGTKLQQRHQLGHCSEGETEDRIPARSFLPMYPVAREAKSRVSIVRSVSGVTANEEERSLNIGITGPSAVVCLR